MYEAKQSFMKIAESEMEKLKQLGDVSKDRYYRTLLKQSDIDKEELKIMNEDRNKFLLKAVTNYIKCLKCGDKHDLRIFRLTSLWFNNSTLEEVNMEIEDCCQNIKSYKFLPLMYQLAARMDMKSTNYKFQDTLNKVIERAAVDHPYHTLFCVLALANAKKDTELLKTGQSAKRIQAAKNMIQKLRTGKTNVSDIVVNMEKSYRPTRRFNDNTDKKLNKCSCSYHRYKSFEKSFKLAGGINLPKIITCVGSDGKGRRQLVKGRDDLRQDAVMQQVFGMVNTLLDKNQETRKRKLQIRQYKISGLLEWCEGTIPIGEYLVGTFGGPTGETKGAHHRYRPRDQSAHFFMEKFPDPAVWYEKRLAYTKSVATNSIGVAFEQGRILPTPETVPFRLTRDIIDGESAENVNKLAERVLIRLHQKLQGIEDGVQLSVPGQVNHLIQEARDPKNLSRLFPGWQPYI
ncbi:hypothetical protein KUTeg_006672 [Tegillarca granosa]|uniref:non-specific serine/threonine protein kinase n=1 Tax=Tegillarca granosa TaxID=220873 RepID=A0ABQ9FDG4_TEGGR|nr:hypothetical protein KUTeg_006672 [Tegillarca granosa]